MKKFKIFLFLSLIVFSSKLISYDKWIVVTSIQHPTPQLKNLANIDGWHLLVVGDKKTPKDWNLENCEYLSPEKQLALGYELASLLPFNHYCRKNIGYLYAIANGAEIIYDTDDDNEPINGLNPVQDGASLPHIGSQDGCVNIYSYFGKSAVWPRGYPLELIKNSKALELSKNSCVQVGIEQGLVNGDPDVDAIFRLTQYGQIDIEFEKKSSCALEKEVYCPFNSQNTFYHKKAFHALYIPSTVSMRVADIWRGYYARKLIGLSGLALIFSAASAFQARNEHNLLNDFKQEGDLYLKSGQLVNFLRGWSFEGLSTAKFDVYGNGKDLQTLSEDLQVMISLFKDLASSKFIGDREVDLCLAWVRDFSKVGK